MPRNWLGASSAFVCALLFLCAVPTTSAKATRPIVNSSRILDAVSLSVPKDLDDVRDHGLMGLNLEDSKLHSKTIAQAKAYAEVRHNGSARAIANFLTRCAKEKSENPFCELETNRVAEKTSANEIKALIERVPLDQVRKAIENADLKTLAIFPVSSVTRAVNQYVDFAPALKAAQKIASVRDCSISGEVAWAFASRAEEFFPDIAMVELSKTLHSRAAECGNEVTANRSRFRFALISIWQNKCADADPQLKKLSVANDLHFQARAKYWRYHCAGVAGDVALQKEMRDALWRDHTLSFHSLAANAGDPRLQELLRAPQAPIKVQLRSLLRPDVNRHLRATEALLEIREPGFSADAMETYITKLATAEPEVRLYGAALMNRAGYALPKFKILSSLLQETPRYLNRETLTLLFPKWYYEFIQARSGDVDSLLILALIRQESAFNVKAHSLAGARGLMQVMPATARSIASVRRDRLFDPKTNIRVGTKYFLHRLGQYNNDVELTLAAYNAGFSRVDKWVKRYPMDNKILFMDFVPFRETRDYISSILRNYFWYTQLYSASAMPNVTPILNANAGASAVHTTHLSQ